MIIRLESPIIERVIGPDCKSSAWSERAGKVFSSAIHRASRRRQRWARSVKGQPRANGSRTGVSVREGVEGKATISKGGVEND